jgi:single-stranded-DNA-specific exonuclease
MDEAKAIAGELNAANRLRQEQTRETVDRIRARVDSAQAPSIVAEWDPGFSIGIAGLVASRLTEEYYRPAVVAQQMEETTRASARSIPEFPILEALESCADLLLEFGGHAAAAGFTVRTSDFEALRERLTTMAGAALEGKDLAPRLQIDAVVELPQLGLSLLEWLDAIEPCGFGNPTPVFAVRDARVLQAKTVGAEGSHLKLTLSQGRRSFDAIAFRRGDMAGALPRQVDAAFSVERNLYLGRETLELNVQDIRPAGEGGWFEK